MRTGYIREEISRWEFDLRKTLRLVAIWFCSSLFASAPVFAMAQEAGNCPLPIRMKVRVGAPVRVELMSCLSRPAGYTWHKFDNSPWPRWAKLTEKGIFSGVPTPVDIGTSEFVAMASHGGSDFYFFPLEVEVIK